MLPKIYKCNICIVNFSHHDILGGFVPLVLAKDEMLKLPVFRKLSLFSLPYYMAIGNALVKHLTSIQM